ncbi:hypothetical protein D3C79_817350 [compost metagenome]
MLGTSNVSVIRSRSITCKVCSASKLATSTWLSPARNWISARAIPATWNSGATCSKRPPAIGGMSTIRGMQADQRLRCDCITPLGKPVVPPVYMMQARSSPPRPASSTAGELAISRSKPCMPAGTSPSPA